jgi:hypothetical protein
MWPAAHWRVPVVDDRRQRSQMPFEGKIEHNSTLVAGPSRRGSSADAHHLSPVNYKNSGGLGGWCLQHDAGGRLPDVKKGCHTC